MESSAGSFETSAAFMAAAAAFSFRKTRPACRTGDGCPVQVLPSGTGGRRVIIDMYLVAALGL